MTRMLSVPGRKVACDVLGEGPPVLLVMGFGMPRAAWDPQLHGLSDRYTVCAYDHRGIGGSTPGGPGARALGLPIGLHHLADDAVDVLDALGWPTAHVVGVSMGGMVAQHLAARHPTRLRSLSLIATHPGGKLMDTLPASSAIGTFLRANRSRGEARLAALRELLYPPGEAPPSRGFDVFAHPSPPRVRLTQLASILLHDTHDVLPSLGRVPTLVLKPEQDLLVPPHNSDRLAQRIPGARLVSFPSGGHGLTAQHALLVNQLLHEHFASADVA